MHSVRGFVSGRVQGVGFRYFVRGLAQQFDLRGYAHNLADGRVEFMLQGEASAVELALREVHRGPRYALVRDVELEAAQDLPPRESFTTR